ncbi:hypothetical protein BH23ACT4_BH23ACT4_15760 [soil metagenome]
MAWIDTLPEDKWDGDLSDLRMRVVDPSFDRVDSIMSIHSLDPEGMDAHHRLYVNAMTGTRTLRKVDRELIALVVSQINECHY